MKTSPISKIFIILVFISTFVFANSLELTDQEKQYLENKKTLQMPTYQNWQPFNFVRDATPQGYIIDLSSIIADRLNLKLQFVNGYSWPDHMQMLKDGQVDIIGNMVKTDERKKTYSFADKNTLTLITGLISFNNYTSISELQGK